MKVTFVGAGRVGSTSAFLCAINLDLDEITLIDVVEDLAVGEAMDISHAASAFDRFPKVTGTSDFSEMKGSDLIVVAAGVARKPGMSRLDLASKNAGIIRDIAKNIREHSPKSKVIVVTNPLDVMTYVMWKESGKDRREVFGMGSILDTVRLKERIVRMGGRFGRVFMMGEHGDSMFFARTISEVEGVDVERAVEETRKVAAEVIRRKGATVYGPASCVYRMVRAVVEDRKEEIPTSVVLDGEYGIRDVALGVPAIIGREGVEKIVEYDLSEDELNSLKRSAEILRDRLKELGY